MRYRVNDKKLPGSPDIVLKKYSTVVFIDGCFWHAHKGCRYYKMPKSNVEFWKTKLAKNTARDYVNNVDLQLAGWRVIRVWECEVKLKATRDETLNRIYSFITQRAGSPKPKQIKAKKKSGYDDYPDDFNIAAEPELEYD